MVPVVDGDDDVRLAFDLAGDRVVEADEFCSPSPLSRRVRRRAPPPNSPGWIAGFQEGMEIEYHGRAFGGEGRDQHSGMPGCERGQLRGFHRMPHSNEGDGAGQRVASIAPADAHPFAPIGHARGYHAYPYLGRSLADQVFLPVEGEALASPGTSMPSIACEYSRETMSIESMPSRSRMMAATTARESQSPVAS